MYKQNRVATTSLRVNESYVGETIEQKINRITNNGEPISDGAPLIYTERNEGVLPDYDIRTDRFDVAIDAMTLVDKSNKAKRDNRHKAKEEAKKEEPKKDGGAEPVQATKDAPKS